MTKINGTDSGDSAQEAFDRALSDYLELFRGQFARPNPDPRQPPIIEINAEQVIAQIALLSARLETIQSILLMPSVTPPQYNAAYLTALNRKIAEMRRPAVDRAVHQGLRSKQ